jgi:hypothetical protein
MNINPEFPSSLRRAAITLFLLAGAACMPDGLCADAPVPSLAAASLRFNFSGQARPGMTTVARSRDGGVPLYDAARGYGAGRANEMNALALPLMVGGNFLEE